jgi:hypothetical protein
MIDTDEWSNVMTCFCYLDNDSCVDVSHCAEVDEMTSREDMVCVGVPIDRILGVC